MTTTPAPHPLSYSLPAAWESALGGWLTWLVAAGSSAATRRTRRAHIRSTARVLGAEHPSEVTTEHLLAILGRPQLSLEHRRGLRASLASFYCYCLAAGVVETDPAAGLPVIRTPLGTPKPATDEIWRQILDTADCRTLLMARLAGEAGLRRAEVAQVHTNDLIDHPEGPQLIVHGKGGKQRVVPITTSLAAEIARACPHGGFLFPGQVDGHMSADHVGKLVSKVMPPGWSMHKLRHRFATRGYAGTGNLRAVQEALGHASVATTQRYTAVSSSDIRRVSEAAGDNTLSRNDLAPVPMPDPDVLPGEERAEVDLDEVPGRQCGVGGASTELAQTAEPPAAEKPTPTSDFERLIETWDEVAHCDQLGGCRRPATWRLNLHGCEQALKCGQHMNSWKRRAVSAFAGGDLVVCDRCEGRFERIEDACTITRL